MKQSSSSEHQVSRSFHVSQKFRLPAYGISSSRRKRPSKSSRTEIMQEIPHGALGVLLHVLRPEAVAEQGVPWDTCTIGYVLYPPFGNLVLPRLKILPLDQRRRCLLSTVAKLLSRMLLQPRCQLISCSPAENAKKTVTLNLNYFELKEPTVDSEPPFYELC